MKLEMYQLDAFVTRLKEEEKSQATIDKYRRDVDKLYCFLGTDTEVDKNGILEFKEHLVKNYMASSVNSILVAVNRFLVFCEESNLQVKLLSVQREVFSREERELTREEYLKLVNTAEKAGNDRLSLLMQTICATGIRVSEIVHITVEAAKTGVASVSCKGKTRIIMIPTKLQRMLIRYVKRQQITSGCIFVTRNGNPIDRSNIWSAMKSLCEMAGVPDNKVFPHNLRHLFAICFYNLKQDLVKLADVLGHSQIETTRIYTRTSGKEHKKQINALNLLI